MKGSIIVLLFFAAGCLLGVMGWLPFNPEGSNLTLYMLYALMLQVGLSIGSSKDLKFIVGSLRPKYLLIPLGTVCGTLLFSALASLLLSRWSIFDCMAVGSGFAYYSLSSILITQFKEPSIGLQLATELGTIALLANIFREMMALLGTPLLCKYFGKLAPISAAGVNSMDVVLPLLFRQRHDACRHFPRHPDRHERSVFCISVLPAVELSAGCLRVFKNFYTFGPLTKKNPTVMQFNNSQLRRQDRLLDEKRAFQLLKEGTYGILSMQDENGEGAYGIPVNYVWDHGNSIYIHCAPVGRKLRCMDACNKVSFCVVGHTEVRPDQFTTAYESVVLRCSAYRTHVSSFPADCQVLSRP